MQQSFKHWLSEKDKGCTPSLPFLYGQFDSSWFLVVSSKVKGLNPEKLNFIHPKKIFLEDIPLWYQTPLCQDVCLFCAWCMSLNKGSVWPLNPRLQPQPLSSPGAVATFIISLGFQVRNTAMSPAKEAVLTWTTCDKIDHFLLREGFSRIKNQFIHVVWYSWEKETSPRSLLFSCWLAITFKRMNPNTHPPTCT